MELRAYSGPSTEWLWETDEIEAACRSVSVGGLAADLGMIDRELLRKYREATESVVAVPERMPDGS